MQKGWVKTHRQLLDWEWYTDVNTCHLFRHLILKANIEDKNWRGISVKRGELITGRKILATETGLTEQQIRTSIKKLKSTSNLTTKTTNKYSLYKVENYNDYQDNNQQPNQQVTNKQPTSNQQVTTTKEYNNIIIKEDISKDIESKDPKTYGNPDINKLFVFLKKQLGLEDFEETKKVQRQYGMHLVNLAKKIGKEEFVNRLKSLADEEFHLKKLGSLKYMHKKIKGFVGVKKDTSIPEFGFNLDKNE